MNVESTESLMEEFATLLNDGGKFENITPARAYRLLTSPEYRAAKLRYLGNHPSHYEEFLADLETMAAEAI